MSQERDTVSRPFRPSGGPGHNRAHAALEAQPAMPRADPRLGSAHGARGRPAASCHFSGRLASRRKVRRRLRPLDRRSTRFARRDHNQPGADAIARVAIHRTPAHREHRAHPAQRPASRRRHLTLSAPAVRCALACEPGCLLRTRGRCQPHGPPAVPERRLRRDTADLPARLPHARDAIAPADDGQCRTARRCARRRRQLRRAQRGAGNRRSLR